MPLPTHCLATSCSTLTSLRLLNCVALCCDKFMSSSPIHEVSSQIDETRPPAAAFSDQASYHRQPSSDWLIASSFSRDSLSETWSSHDPSLW